MKEVDPSRARAPTRELKYLQLNLYNSNNRTIFSINFPYFDYLLLFLLFKWEKVRQLFSLFHSITVIILAIIRIIFLL